MIFVLVLVVSATSAHAAYQYDPYTPGQYVQKSDPGVLSQILSFPGKVFGNVWNLLNLPFQTIPLSIAYIFSSIMTLLGFIQGKPTYMNFYQGNQGYPTLWG